MNDSCWGRYPAAAGQRVLPVFWSHQLPDLRAEGRSFLPRGLGRSYGDSCLNPGGTLLDMVPMDRLLQFDPATGLLRCEAGVSLDTLLRVFVPRGFFLPTTPGTRFVTVGGAIANDVHGKNHHQVGTFGALVRRLELARSDGSRVVCSREDHGDLFRATIGGLGLTGIITWAEFPLVPIDSHGIESESIKTRDLDEFFDLSEASEADWPFIVSWVDVTASGRGLGRGLFNRGRFASREWAERLPEDRRLLPPKEPRLSVPFDLPGFLLNPFTIRWFNRLYYAKQFRDRVHAVGHFEPFFYPLDAIRDWNRGYGKRGFLQWQCLVPWDQARPGIRGILQEVAASGLGSPVSVMKTCGAMAPEGLLSFMQGRGVTLAMDFPMSGQDVLDLCERLDARVRDVGGAVYPAKDARMSPTSFRAFFPRLEEFLRHRDPALSSGFWRRVMPQEVR